MKNYIKGWRRGLRAAKTGLSRSEATNNLTGSWADLQKHLAIRRQVAQLEMLGGNAAQYRGELE